MGPQGAAFKSAIYRRHIMAGIRHLDLGVLDGPLVLFGGPSGVSLRDGKLSDLAPSLLELMCVEQPAEMTGESLIVH